MTRHGRAARRRPSAGVHAAVMLKQSRRTVLSLEVLHAVGVVQDVLVAQVVPDKKMPKSEPELASEAAARTCVPPRRTSSRARAISAWALPSLRDGRDRRGARRARLFPRGASARRRNALDPRCASSECPRRRTRARTCSPVQDEAAAIHYRASALTCRPSRALSLHVGRRSPRRPRRRSSSQSTTRKSVGDLYSRSGPAHRGLHHGIVPVRRVHGAAPLTTRCESCSFAREFSRSPFFRRGRPLLSTQTQRSAPAELPAAVRGSAPVRRSNIDMSDGAEEAVENAAPRTRRPRTHDASRAHRETDAVVIGGTSR